MAMVLLTATTRLISDLGDQPRIQYGFGMNVRYKNWDLGVFFNGFRDA